MKNRNGILPDLERTSFSFDECIYESSERLNYAYFPTTCVVSLVYTMLDGASAEMGIVGNEGFRWYRSVNGRRDEPQPSYRTARGRRHQDEGVCLSGRVQAWGPFQRLLLRYTQALFTQISQKAVCNGLHP